MQAVVRSRKPSLTGRTHPFLPSGALQAALAAGMLFHGTMALAQ